MGRHRKHDPEGVLNAAERVVLRRGASGLSIDAVAKEAGIAKSSVLYDYKSKSAVLEALVGRIIAAEDRKVSAAVAAAEATPNPELFGRIEAVAAVRPSADERAVVMAVSAAASSEDAFQHSMREWLARDLEAIQAGAEKPFASLMAYLALYGLSTIEYQGFGEFESSERAAILDGIKSIFELIPENPVTS
jgi:AcrR family transcriptional regulator